MLYLLGVTCLLAVLHIEYTDAGVCGTRMIWRNNNQTCPDRTICADVFNTVRDWLNGTRCEETRILSNCLCPGGTVCPVNDPSHMLYSSSAHTLYLCRPKCNLPWCQNTRLSRYPSPGRETSRASPPPIAMTTEQEAAEFDNKNYNRMNCRCPRHHVPTPSTNRRVIYRAVRGYRHEFDINLHRYSYQYICDMRDLEDQQEDPCSQTD